MVSNKSDAQVPLAEQTTPPYNSEGLGSSGGYQAPPSDAKQELRTAMAKYKRELASKGPRPVTPTPTHAHAPAQPYFPIFVLVLVGCLALAALLFQPRFISIVEPSLGTLLFRMGL